MIIFGVSLTAKAASFSCEKTEAADERSICNHRDLNDMDVEMAVRLDILKNVLPMGGRSSMLDEQENWLKERQTCRADVNCLFDVYGRRLKVLRGVLSEFTKQGSQ